MSMETLHLSPTFEGSSDNDNLSFTGETPTFEPTSEGSTPTVFDELGQDFDQWRQELEAEPSAMTRTMNSSPTTGQKPNGTETATDYDWD